MVMISSTYVQQNEEDTHSNRPETKISRGSQCWTYSTDSDEAQLLRAGLDFLTIQTLNRLFPRSRTAWKPFLMSLLENATTEPPEVWTQILSYSAEEYQDDAAVAYFTGIDDLSKKLHLAYETAHLYYTLFKSLGLIFSAEQVVQRHKRLILVLPLASYRIPEALSEQLEQFKARYGRRQARLLAEQVSCHLAHSMGLEQDAYSDHRVPERERPIAPDIFTSLQTILRLTSVETDEQIIKRLTEKMHSFLGGDIQNPDVEACSNAIGTQREVQGHYCTADTERVGNLSESSRVGSQDSVLQAEQTEGVSVSPPQTSLTSQDSSQTNLVIDKRPVDSLSIVSINGSKLSLINKTNSDTDSTDTPAKQKRQSGEQIPSPTDVLSRREICGQATALAQVVEGKTDNVGAFIKLLRLHTPHVVRAACIATLVRKYFPEGLGSLQRPGGYFTRRCEEYEKTSIPESMLTSVRVYEALSYKEIEQILWRQAQEQKIRHKHRSYIAPQEGDVDCTSLPHPRRGAWMTRPTAEALVVRISHDKPQATTVGIRDVQQGSNVISVVDVRIEEVIWTITSQEDWFDYITAIKQLEVLQNEDEQ